MIIILSDDGRFRAIVHDTPECVEVSFWEQGRGDGIQVWSKLQPNTTLDCPWHVALDRIHDVVQQLRQEVHYLSKHGLKTLPAN